MSLGVATLQRLLHLFLRRSVIAASGCLFAVSVTHAQTGVMRAGTWQIETHFVSAEGPGSRKPAVQNPSVAKVCMAQSFVDQDNYSNPVFSMGRPRGLGFTCQLTAMSGERTAAS